MNSKLRMREELVTGTTIKMVGGAHSRDCCVPMCSSRSSTNRNMTYFSFPSNEACKRVWAKLISRRGANGKLWMPKSEAAKVCSLHFLDSDFRDWANYKRLLPNALPTVFPHYPPKLRHRQAKIVEIFRKANPLGLLSTGPSNRTMVKSKRSIVSEDQGGQSESSVSSMRTEEADEMTNETDVFYDGLSLSVDQDEESETKNTPEQTLKPEDSATTKNHSEDSKPFKKRRIETLPSSGEDSSEHNFSAERCLSILEIPLAGSSNDSELNLEKNRQSREKELDQQVKKRTIRSDENSVKCKLVKNSNQVERFDNGTLGRGKRARKPPVRLEYNSEETKEAEKSELDEDYTPDQSSKKSLKILENGTSEESQSIRKIKRLQQQIKWRDEQLLNLNQKSVKEREARRKAENELEALRNSMKNNVSVTLEDCNKPSASSCKADMPSNDKKTPREYSEDIKCDRTVGLSMYSSGEGKSFWIEQIKKLKQEIASKDGGLASLNKKCVYGRNEKVKIQGISKPKKRFLHILKTILEDSMEGDAKALFLLEQLEAYGKQEVTNFRMSTIRKCVEWKLLNAKGYESVRNMQILTLPSIQILREHVDVMADTGVTAAEEVRLDRDLVELIEELSEEDGLNDVDTDYESMYGFHLNKKKMGPNRNNSCRTVVNEKTPNKESENGMQKIVGKCRQFNREIVVEGGSFGKKGKTSAEVVHSITEQPRQPFKLKLSSGILIEEIQPTDENPSCKTTEKKDSVKTSVKLDHGGYDVDMKTNPTAMKQIIRQVKRQVKREQPSSSSIEEDQLGMVSFNNTDPDSERSTGSVDKRVRNVGISCPRNTNDSAVKEAALVVIAEPDPTSENLINAESSDLEDAMEPSEDYVPDGETYAEVEEAVVVEEELVEEIAEPASEEMDHDYGAQTAEADSLEVKDESEQLPPGCYIENVGSSEEEVDSN